MVKFHCHERTSPHQWHPFVVVAVNKLAVSKLLKHSKEEYVRLRLVLARLWANLDIERLTHINVHRLLAQPMSASMAALRSTGRRRGEDEEDHAVVEPYSTISCPHSLLVHTESTVVMDCVALDDICLPNHRAPDIHNFNR